MGKNKLKRFAEMETFGNVFQPDLSKSFNEPHEMKGFWSRDFFKNTNPLVLELGCGKGEYTVGLAEKHTNKNFIGADIKGARIWKGAKYALENNLQNAAFIRTKIETITSYFAPNEVDEIWLTFPDPQIKKLRKRLSSARFLESYKQFLNPQGIVHLKTDSELLYGFTLDIIKKNNMELIYNTNDLYNSGLGDDELQIKTFYETQYLQRGIKITYIKFRLASAHTITNPEENPERLEKEIAERKRTGTNQIIRS